MDQSICFMFVGVIIIAALIFWLISSGQGHRTGHLNVEQYRLKYLEIENKIKAEEPMTYQMSILEADKLLDQALKEKGFSGDTMGERLKNANSSFTKRNCVWAAHKLRNSIAHESDVKISYREARGALACYRRALKDLRAI